LNINEKLQVDLLHRLPISSHQQHANVFTKPLKPKLFTIQLGIMNIHNPT